MAAGVEVVPFGKSPRDPSPPRARDKTDGKIESQSFLEPPLQNSFRPSSEDSGSVYSADNENERQRGRLLAPSTLRYASTSPAPPQSWSTRCHARWIANKGLAYVLASQYFGALMNVTTRLLETSGEPLNTFQVRQRCFGRFGYGLKIDKGD
ncbi:MAG: hypothetical protein Q9181_005456 [Wetmoreana brouardii]